MSSTRGSTSSAEPAASTTVFLPYLRTSEGAAVATNTGNQGKVVELWRSHVAGMPIRLALWAFENFGF